MKEYWAKSNPYEKIQDHTNELVKQFDIFVEQYGSSMFQKEFVLYDGEKITMKKLFILLYYACVYHDIGKMNSYFQERIKKQHKKMNEKEVHHGYLSVGMLPYQTLQNEFSEKLIRVLFESVFYHHKRKKEDKDKIADEIDRLKEEVSKFDFNIQSSEILKGIRLPRKLNIDNDFENYLYEGNRIYENFKEEEYALFHLYIIVKGLLNKIDYAASGGIEVEIEGKSLAKKTKDYIHCLSANGMNDLQKYMYKHKEENIIVIASTGIGKTEGSLLWIGESKGFFTLPLRVSINSIFDRVKHNIKFQEVALLHSDAVLEYVEREEEEVTTQLINQIKSLSYPLTITTIDQLLDFVFYYEGFEMKLATLSYSKIVIDEIQAYNPKMIAIIILALKKIVELGGKFAIVTATLPPFIIELLHKEKIPFQKPKTFIKKNVNGENLKRHKIKLLHRDATITDILPHVENKKILIIVNTVKKAQQLYKEINEKIRNKKMKINVLHSKFTVSDRKEKEKEILNMGKRDSEETGIWITTQIVEASLDIDFDILFTELSEVCGLIQRLGRVYRNRDLKKENTNVFIWTGIHTTSGISSNYEKSIVDKDIFYKSKIALEKFDNKILTEEDKFSLVEEVYSFENIKKTEYFKTIANYVNDKYKYIPIYEVEKKEINMRELKTVSIIPFRIYKENYEEIEEIIEEMKILSKEKRHIEKIKKEKELLNFSISIRKEEYYRCERLKVIENKIEISKYISIPIVNIKYSYEEGLVFIEDDDFFF